MPISSRQNRLGRLRALARPDVLIVGGGINGIGVYHDLAQQGVRVLLVDKGDFCQGASAALSRMIHGGLRYMENGEFRLVRESLMERNRLLRNAPHYVRPLPTTIPIFERWSGLIGAAAKFLRLSRKPSRRGAVLIKVGLTLYDLFTCRDRVLPTHVMRGRVRTKQEWPEFPNNVACSATYHDAWITAPERLGLELILDVEACEGRAAAMNYMSVVGSDGREITLKDNLSGDQYKIQPKIIVNATGAWLDFTNDALHGGEADRSSSSMVGGTKGSHLVVDNPRLMKALNDQMVYYENLDGRVCIMFPYFGNVLVGSTDLKVDTPEGAFCTDNERDYILKSVAYVFPDIEITRDQILYEFSGVRPLPHSDASATGQISRDHYTTWIRSREGAPILCMIGGKWTTYRAFGEQAADQVLSALGKMRQVHTDAMAIGGGKGYPAEPGQWLDACRLKTGMAPDRLQVLFQRYGTRAADVATFIAEQGDRALHGAPTYSKREILFLIRSEYVLHPLDLLKRRTALAISGGLNAAVLDDILDICGDAFGWTDAERNRYRDETVAHFVKFNGLPQDRLNPTTRKVIGEAYVSHQENAREPAV